MQQREERMRSGVGRCLVLLTACCLLLSFLCHAQEPAPSAPAGGPAEEEQALLPGDWAPQLLDGILSSPNPEAQDALYRAAFAAGPAIVPQLEVAVKDDRTAEFAAQSLAFIGGEKAIQLLWKLIPDPRDLNLRRFYYGALAEFDAPEATQTLLEVVNRADQEPDRTVTEAAILALTVRSDARLIPALREAEKKINDVVIRLDLENALAVIENRALYLATPEGKKTGGSIDDAVRTYFIPALVPPPASKQPPGGRQAPSKPLVTVKVERLTLSPDKTRALARVIFEDPSATADYDIVLQKRYGNWTIASVWLGTEVEKPSPLPPAAPHEPQ